MIYYTRHEITPQDELAVIEALNGEALTQGPRVEEFEENFAQYINSKYAISVNNGTSALHLSALALDVREGQKVITSPITFVASANCIRYCGADIDFCDVDSVTGLLDLNSLEKKLRLDPPGTYAGVIPVDLAGYPLHLEKLKQLAQQYKLWIIEDACHAPGGAFLDANKVWQSCGNGNFADLAIFSLHPAKHIAAGEGGVITTNNFELYEKIKQLRSHGITKNTEDFTHLKHDPWAYEMQVLGYNYRFSDILAALANSQLKRASQGLKRRQEIALHYQEKLQSTPLTLQPFPDTIRHAFHLYTIQSDQRSALYHYLLDAGISTQVHYIPVHTQPYYKSLGFQDSDYPKALEYYNKCLSLPMYPTLSHQEQNYIIQTIQNFFRNS